MQRIIEGEQRFFVTSDEKAFKNWRDAKSHQAAIDREDKLCMVADLISTDDATYFDFDALRGLVKNGIVSINYTKLRQHMLER